MTAQIEEIVAKYGFQHAGELELDEATNLPKFSLYEDWLGKGTQSKKTGIVYLWIKMSGDQIADVTYVGKAGKTLKTRCGQHQGGFSGKSKSKKGLTNARNLREWLTVNGNRVMVYARVSPVIEINDERLSAVSIDEESFIQKFTRLGCALWNFAPKKGKK